MSSFVKQVEIARRGLRGRRTDARVHKAYGQLGSKPTTPQIDQPAGLGNTPPVQQAHNMYEGIDLTSPNFINAMYQRYGASFINRDPVVKHSASDLRKAAGHPDVHPRAKMLLEAAAAVRKAFSGGNPMLPDLDQYPNTSPSIEIPGRPNHGAPGNPVTAYPATAGAQSHSAPIATINQAAASQEPQTATSASRGGNTNLAVGRQWSYAPARGNPVTMPTQDADDYGVGDQDSESKAGAPAIGDLVHFNGPGGSSFQAKVTQLTTGAVIGEFAGQSVSFPLDGISPHRVGGADHATDDGTPAGLSANAGGSGIGLGAKKDDAEFEVRKDQHAAIYDGGQDMSAQTGKNVHLESPDDGARLTQYSPHPPYSAEAGENDGAAPGNPVNGALTARERALIARVISHRGPVATEVAALKALTTNAANDRDRAVLVKALRTHAFAVPATRADVSRITEKLLP